MTDEIKETESVAAETGKPESVEQTVPAEQPAVAVAETTSEATAGEQTENDPKNENKQAVPAVRRKERSRKPRSAQRAGSKRERTLGLRKPKLKQVEVILDPNTTVHLDSRTATRVIRLTDSARSKCVVKLTVTVHSQPAQHLLERYFQHVSWAAERISDYIRRNLRNEKIVEFEEIVDAESNTISQKLDEGIAFFSEHVRNLDSSLKMASHYTRPVEYELPIESNSATRFVRLVMQFDQLCHLLDILTITDSFGNGANVRLAQETRKWRNIVNRMANLIIDTQREAKNLITSDAIPTAESQKNKEALLEVAKQAEEEEKVFANNRPAIVEETVVDVEEVKEIEPRNEALEKEEKAEEQQASEEAV